MVVDGRVVSENYGRSLSRLEVRDEYPVCFWRDAATLVHPLDEVIVNLCCLHSMMFRLGTLLVYRGLQMVLCMCTSTAWTWDLLCMEYLRYEIWNVEFETRCYQAIL